jgi:hypothetical protein
MMKARDHHELGFGYSVDDRVGEFAGDNVPKFPIDFWEGQGHAKRLCDCYINGPGKLEAKTNRPFLVPCLRCHQFLLRFWPENQSH